MVIAVLAVIWVVCLTPMMLRKLSERRFTTSVDSFHRQLRGLRRAYPRLAASAAHPEMALSMGAWRTAASRTSSAPASERFVACGHTAILAARRADHPAVRVGTSTSLERATAAFRADKGHARRTGQRPRQCADAGYFSSSSARCWVSSCSALSLRYGFSGMPRCWRSRRQPGTWRFSSTSTVVRWSVRSRSSPCRIAAASREPQLPPPAFRPTGRVSAEDETWADDELVDDDVPATTNTAWPAVADLHRRRALDAWPSPAPPQAAS